MTNTALITGASSGIGRALAQLHAARGGDLVLVARREDALRALKAELEAAHSITAHVFAADLAAPNGAQDLCHAVDAARIEVEVLINNAGIGGHGKHIERELADELAMVDLNIKALMTLTHHFGTQMAARGRGRILNVGSTAGFMPGPRMATYFATKAFVNSFSQALDQELRKKGVTSTVLTPGYVETGFADVANMRGTQLVKSGGRTPEHTARIGYDAMLRGDLVAFDRLSMRLLLGWVTPLLPRRMLLGIAERTQLKTR